LFSQRSKRILRLNFFSKSPRKNARRDKTTQLSYAPTRTYSQLLAGIPLLRNQAPPVATPTTCIE
jgi:hypothetical protein